MPNELTQAALDEMIEYYKNQANASSQENLVALMREIQELLGCIPEELQQDISAALNVKPALTARLIKLYPSLTSSPALHNITLCLGPRCSKKEAQKILNSIKKAIVHKPFLLKTENCLKQCSKGPNLIIDQDVYNQVKEEDLDAILSQYWP